MKTTRFNELYRGMRNNETAIRELARTAGEEDTAINHRVTAHHDAIYGVMGLRSRIADLEAANRAMDNATLWERLRYFLTGRRPATIAQKVAAEIAPTLAPGYVPPDRSVTRAVAAAAESD